MTGVFQNGYMVFTETDVAVGSRTRENHVKGADLQYFDAVYS